MSDGQRETVRRIVKECTERLEALNYGLLALEIEKLTEQYLDDHYPEATDEG